MPTIPQPSRYDDFSGVDSWRADDDSFAQRDATPDLGRHTLGEARPAGPPGSAPLWSDNGDTVAPPSRGDISGSYASTRSEDLIQKAWMEITREKTTPMSKATFILVHVEVHRRVKGGESDATLGDLRSDAEMNWAICSKGRTVMDFQQFHQACLVMAKGLRVTADAGRYGEFCAAALEACRSVGGHLQVDRPSILQAREDLLSPATLQAREGLLSPCARPPDSPLRGSFPAGVDQASGRWLLRSARPREKRKEDLGQERCRRQRGEGGGGGAGGGGREAAEPEQRRAIPGKQQQQAQPPLPHSDGKTDRSSSPPPEASLAVDCAGSAERPAAGDAAAVFGDRAMKSVKLRTESHGQWPPAWVRQRAAANKCGSGDGGAAEIVLAKGIFAASPAPPTTGAPAGTQVKALDSRLLMGSVSQKAVLLQEELRNDRARLLELRRTSSLAHTGRAPRGASRSPQREAGDGGPHDSYGSANACVGSETGREYSGAPDADDAGRPHRPHNSCGAATHGGVHTETKGPAPPPDALSCYSLGHRIASSRSESGGYGTGVAGAGIPAAAAAVDGAESLGGSEGWISTGSLSTATGRSRPAAKAMPRKKKALVLPCGLCRDMESALWCAECKLSFCAICFAKVPHHQGTGLVVHDPARENCRRQAAPSTPGGAANVRRAGHDANKGKRCDPVRNLAALSSTGSPPPEPERQQLAPAGRLRRGRLQSTPSPAENSAPELSAMDLEGRRTGAARSRRRNHRASAVLEKKQQQGHLMNVLRQDELAAFRSIPALCLNSGADGLSSARDFHNNKYALAAAKAVSPRGLPLDLSNGNGRYGGGCNLVNDGGAGGDIYDGREAGGKAVGAKGLKTFGGTSVRIIVR